MARRSLASWAGMPHTETLSLLALGSTLTSMDRFDEAAAALDQARRLGEQQGSKLFIGEALARLARLHWCAGDASAARTVAERARAAAGETAEPLRASALALISALTAPRDATSHRALSQLAPLADRSGHPVAQARRWRAVAALCAAAGDRAGALAAARRLDAVARAASLSEWHCEALWLLALLDTGAAAAEAHRAATRLAAERGFGWLTPERLPRHFVP